MAKLTYSKATERLDEIMHEIENEQLDVDTLTDTLKEAKKLIDFCKQRLYDVDKSIREMTDEQSETTF
ncbi:MAG: exodeoxyribonuclease VII small subunit [Prevotellaceae bacterium]|nr:exodeoxyribonuclease VII small subunit [Prevotellaceae bacterium]